MHLLLAAMLRGLSNNTLPTAGAISSPQTAAACPVNGDSQGECGTADSDLVFSTHVNDTSDGESTPEDRKSKNNGDSTVSRQAEFPAEQPTMRRLPDQSEALIGEGYDSDGELPF